MLNDAKNELLDALRVRDKSNLSLEELKIYADILKVLSDVSDTSSTDVLTESMRVMAEAMKEAAAPMTMSPVAYAI